VASRRIDGCVYGFLFSVSRQSEGLGQVQRGLVERLLMHGCPKIQDVPVDPTIGLEAAEDVLPEMHRERSTRFGGLAVYRTRTAELLASAVELLLQT
jgi:hypothetical protein